MAVNTGEGFSFDLESITVEEISRRVAEVYKPVDPARFPMFRWVQILNDSTTLGEEVRRNRRREAVARTGRVLMRLLDFIGHYLYVHEPGPNESQLADLVSHALKATSYSSYFGSSGPEEGPTRWILAKFPFACAKCGHRPCECFVRPWVFEERRENPGPFAPYREKTLEKRRKLGTQNIQLFTLPGLCQFFHNIYRGTYYNQDPWRLTMHLSEELGEATVELSRMNLAWLAQMAGFNPKDVAVEVQKQADIKIGQDTRRIRGETHRKRTKSDAWKELRKMVAGLRGKAPWDAFLECVGPKFKEEIADVFSWLAAIIYALSDEQIIRELRKITNRYVTKRGYAKVLACPWCGEKHCSNSCLVSHEITEELIEMVFRP